MRSVEQPVSTRPRLVVVYGHRSLNALQLAEAAHGLCDLIWLVDTGDQSAMAVLPLLKRSGTVVQALGLPAAEAAAAVRPLAPDGLTTFYDTGMEHVAAIAAELGLPFNDVGAARALEDKFHQREAMRAAGLPTPPVVSLPASADRSKLEALIDGVTYPAILKPRRASGSWHTFRADSADELMARLIQLEDEPVEERIVEGYLPDGPAMPGGFEADYVSVETVAVDGVMTHLATTGRFPLVEPFRETGFFIPSTLDRPTTESVLSVADAALKALGVRWGCAHTEIKLTAEGPRVIEINGRIGGGVPEMLWLAAGIDLIPLAMRAALRMDLRAAAMPQTQGVAYRFFYQPPSSACRLLELDGLAALARQSGVDDVFMHHRPGTELDAAHGTRTYLFAVVGHAEDHEGVVAMRDYLDREIRATYEHVEQAPQPRGSTR